MHRHLSKRAKLTWALINSAACWMCWPHTQEKVSLLFVIINEASEPISKHNCRARGAVSELMRGYAYACLRAPISTIRGNRSAIAICKSPRLLIWIDLDIELNCRFQLKVLDDCCFCLCARVSSLRITFIADDENWRDADIRIFKMCRCGLVELFQGRIIILLFS